MIFDSHSLEKKRKFENTVKYSNMQSVEPVVFKRGNFYAVNVCIIYGKKTFLHYEKQLFDCYIYIY